MLGTNIYNRAVKRLFL